MQQRLQVNVPAVWLIIPAAVPVLQSRPRREEICLALPVAEPTDNIATADSIATADPTVLPTQAVHWGLRHPVSAGTAERFLAIAFSSSRPWQGVQLRSNPLAQAPRAADNQTNRGNRSKPRHPQILLATRPGVVKVHECSGRLPH